MKKYMNIEERTKRIQEQIVSIKVPLIRDDCS